MEGKLSYKEKYEKEKRLNTILCIGLILIAVGFVVESALDYENQLRKEDLCYLSNYLVDYVNQLHDLIDLEVEDFNEIKCYSGNAERRLG